MTTARILATMFATAALAWSAAVFAQAPSAPVAPSDKAYGLLGEAKSANYVVRLSSNPAQPIRGLDKLEAIVTGPDGSPITDAQVFFDLNMTTMNHGKNVVAATQQGAGRYLAELRFMMPGPWRVIVHVGRPDRPLESLRFEFKVTFR